MFSEKNIDRIREQLAIKGWDEQIRSWLLGVARQHGVICEAAAKIKNAEAKSIDSEVFRSAGIFVRKICPPDPKRGNWCGWPP